MASIDYLLNPQRVKNGTAKILKGDESLTRNLIKSLDFKQKACVGCLSFEEKNIDDSIKKEIMESFENTLLTSEMVGRYNILWVEHTDKGRLELNFVIPKVDLETQKSFNPYFHKADLKRIDLWGDLINLSYGFTNPKDPAKEQQSIKNINHHAKTFNDHKDLDNHFKELAITGLIKSRDELIAYIENDLNGIVELTRKGKDYLGIKLQGDKKAARYKGEIYQNGNFKDIFREENARKQRAVTEFSRARDEQNLKNIREELGERIQQKIRFIRTRYKTQASNDNKQHGESDSNTNLQIGIDYPNPNLDNQRNALFLGISSEKNAESMEYSQRQENDYSATKSGEYTNDSKGNIHNAKGLEYELNGEHINRIAGRKRQADTRAREYEERNRRIRTQIGEYEQRKRQADTRAREYEERKQQALARARKLDELSREQNNKYKQAIREYNANEANLEKLRNRAKKLRIERFIKSFNKSQLRFKKLQNDRYTAEQRFRNNLQQTISAIQNIRNNAINRADITRNTLKLFERLRSDFSKIARKLFAERIDAELNKRRPQITDKIIHKLR